MAAARHWCRYEENTVREWGHYHEVNDDLVVETHSLLLSSRRVFRMYLPYIEAWYEAVEFPRERFVTYEPSDAVWAVPLGIAKVVKRMIMPGILLNLSRFIGEDREVFVENAVADRNCKSDSVEVLVTGFVPKVVNER